VGHNPSPELVNVNTKHCCSERRAVLSKGLRF